jgi:hypothetical protein
MAKTRIQQDGSEVVLTGACLYTGEPVERRFWAPPSGGYVREVTNSRPGTLGQQVCAGLTDRGSTLHVSAPEKLLPLIRSEWQRARRIAKSDPWAI